MGWKAKAVSEFGSVQKHGNGWRVRVDVGCALVVSGPPYYRLAARRKAEADLAQARQASTREEMQPCLRDMVIAKEGDASMLKWEREEADATHCSWAVHVLQDEASELTVIAEHLGMRKAKRGVAPAPFTGWEAHMKEQVSYASMVQNVRRLCGWLHCVSSGKIK